LVELMVTVAVVAILMAIGAPSLKSFLVKQQVAADIDSLSSALHLARSEALKRSGTVTVCPLAAGSTNSCVTTATTTSWSNGWLVFIDYGTQGVYEPPTGGSDVILKVEQTVRSGTISTGSSRAFVSFSGNGVALGGVGGTTFLIVSFQGRTRVGSKTADCT